MIPELFLAWNISCSPCIINKKIDTVTIYNSYIYQEKGDSNSKEKISNSTPQNYSIETQLDGYLTNIAFDIFNNLKDLNEEEKKEYNSFINSSSEIVTKVL